MARTQLILDLIHETGDGTESQGIEVKRMERALSSTE